MRNIRIRPPTRRNTKLNLGSFNRIADGWVNCDVSRHIFVDRIPWGAEIASRLGFISEEQFDFHRRQIWNQVFYLNLSRPLPFQDSSVAAVYSSHLLEHLPRSTALNLLKECRRVMSAGAVIRTSVPDLDTVLADYDAAFPDRTLGRIFEMGTQTKDRHWWMYNEVSLRELLDEAGFSQIARCRFQEGACPDVQILDNRPEESLFMEAIARV